MGRLLRQLSSDELQKKKLVKAHKANYRAGGRRVMKREREGYKLDCNYDV
jgi:hypothetical protein